MAWSKSSAMTSLASRETLAVGISFAVIDYSHVESGCL